MIIRQAQVSELAQVVPLFDDYYAASPVPHTVDHLALQVFLKTIVSDERQGQLLLAETPTGQLVGFALLYRTYDTRKLRPVVILNDLFVAEKVRRQGVARKLMAATFEWAQGQGAVSVVWQTRTSNKGAQKLYHQLGVQEEGWLHFSHEL